MYKTVTKIWFWVPNYFWKWRYYVPMFVTVCKFVLDVLYLVECCRYKLLHINSNFWRWLIYNILFTSLYVFCLLIIRPVQPPNTRLFPFGSMVSTSRISSAITVMSLITLRNCFSVVSCQLARLRLLPTAQAMKADVTQGPTKAEVSFLHLLNTEFPMILPNVKWW